MAATPAPTTTEPPAPADPGIIAGTTVLGFVPLRGPAAEAAVRAAQVHAPRIAWGNLVLLKLLLPIESQSMVISPWGAQHLAEVAEALLSEVRERAL